MNCDEFSREFDILYNNITSNQAPSLNSYEKSVFLTQAQEDIVLSLYRGDNKKSFDLTEEFASYLSPIIKNFDTEPYPFIDKGESTNFIPDNITKVFAGKYRVSLIDTIKCYDCWFIAYESALVSSVGKCNIDKFCEVIPTTYDALIRDCKNPFKKPTNNRVFRLNIGEMHERYLYLIHDSNSDLTKYHCVYLKRPDPIILEDLDKEYAGYNLSINGITKKTECELGSAIHRQILIKAVDLAKTIWTSTIINSSEEK